MSYVIIISKKAYFWSAIGFAQVYDNKQNMKMANDFLFPRYEGTFRNAIVDIYNLIKVNDMCLELVLF